MTPSSLLSIILHSIPILDFFVGLVPTEMMTQKANEYTYIYIFFFSFKEIEENALTNAFSFVIVFFSFFAYTENEFFFSHDSFGDKNLMKRRLIDVFLIRDFLHKSSDRYLPGNVTVMKKKMLQRDEEEKRRQLHTMTQEQHALLSYHTRVMHSF